MLDFLEFFRISHGSLGFFGNFLGFSGILTKSVDLFLILSDSLAISRVLSNSSGFSSILPNSFRFYHILLDSSGFSRIFLEFFSDFLVLFKILFVFFQIQLDSGNLFSDSLKITRILLNSSGLSRILSEYFGFSHILSNPSCFSRIFCNLFVMFSDFPYFLGFSPILSDTLRFFLYLIFSDSLEITWFSRIFLVISSILSVSLRSCQNLSGFSGIV